MPDDTSTPSGRVAWYLRKLWLGSQTRMAADTGLTQAAVSKVVLGRRNPGRRFLLAVAGHPLVNGAWLLSGIGEPLLQPGTEGAAGESMLPLARRLLPGPVEAHCDCLSGAYIPVVRGDFAPSRYWYRVGDSDRFDHGLTVGDLLLLETNRSWLRQPDRLKNVWCIIVPILESEPLLGWVEAYESKKGVIVRPWSEPASSSTPRATLRAEHPRRALKRRPVRDNDVDAKAIGPSPMSPAESKKATPTLGAAKPTSEWLPLSTVVGLTVLLLRR